MTTTKEKKKNQLGLRYTDTVKKIIENYPDGKGFSDKLEKLLIKAHTELPAINTELKEKKLALSKVNKELELKLNVAKLEQRQNQLNDEIKKKSSMLGDLERIQNYIEWATSYAEKNI